MSVTHHTLSVYYDGVESIEDTCEAAAKVLAALWGDVTDESLLQEILVPIVAADIARERRNDTRKVEQEVAAAEKKRKRKKAAARKTRSVTVEESEQPKATFRDLLDMRFYNGTIWVHYHEATVRDYEGSIEFLEKKVNGYRSTIRFRQLCIDTLTDHGVGTMADLPDDVLGKLSNDIPEEDKD